MGFEEFSSDAGDDSCKKDPDYICESMISSSPGSCDSRSKSIILEQQDEQFSSKRFDRYRSEPDLTNFLDNCQRSSQQIPDEHQAYPCRQLLTSDSSGVHENTVEGASEHAGPSANDSQTHCSAKSQKQRPKRLCKFCITWNLHLTRHLKRKHKNEEEVELALKLPKKEQERAFGGLKKAGIFKANMANRESDQNASLIRERSQGRAETVMCTGCRGYYDAKSIFKHKRFCERNVSELANTAKMYELSDNAAAAGVDNDFKENILNRFTKNDLGDICRTDLVTILFGKKQWAKSVKKERSITMSEMRVLASLIRAFRQESGDEKASGHDILDYRRFDVLENVVRKMCVKENGEDKAGLKVRIGFVLKRAVKIMRGYFVIKGDSQKEADMSRFLDVLPLNWDFIFFTAQVECEQRRSGLRNPSAMPDEEDISIFRMFVINEIKKIRAI